MKLNNFFIIALIMAFITGCKTTELVDSSGVNMLETTGNVYTMVNLHPDEKQLKLYTVNYQREGLIPACSKVKLDAFERKRLTFTVVSTGKTYIMDKHKSSPDFPAYLKKYFGTECVSSKIKKLSSTDRKGIEKGIVTKGMTKQGVLYAIGYPPEHHTPSTNLNEWKYWINRFKTMVVRFDDKGKVTHIVK